MARGDYAAHVRIPAENRCSAAEASGGTAGASAAVAVAEAQATQDAAILRAAAKAAEVLAQVGSRLLIRRSCL